MFILSLPYVQTRLGKIVINYVNSELGTNIIVKGVDLSLLGNVQLKDIEIKDHHKDTLIFVKKIKTSILNFRKIINNNVYLDDVFLDGVNLFMKTYKGEKEDNLSIFIDAFNKEQANDTISSTFSLKTENIYLDDLNYKLIDYNDKQALIFSALGTSGSIEDFELLGSNLSMKLRGMYFIENNGLEITNLTTDFTYNKTKMKLFQTTLQTTKGTNLKGDIILNYKNFSKFTDKVKINSTFTKSYVSIKDLNKFYHELKGNDKIFLSGNLKGTLNNFSVTNLKINSKKGLYYSGEMGFVNSFKTERGFVFDAKINKLTASYIKLNNVLPNVLGITIPKKIKKLGKFSLSGLIKVTPEQIDATLKINSEIGGLSSDLLLTNIRDINNAKYSGEIELFNFNLGKVSNDPLLGNTSLKADVYGKGFDVKNINTTIIGEIFKIDFKGYQYNNLTINGQVENRKFDGFLKSEDENFKLIFEGLADFSNKTNKFDFSAKIEKIDLFKTKLFVRDTISKLKGNIKLDIVGNSFEDIIGKIEFENLLYTNEKKSYEFKKIEIESSKLDSIRIIQVNSKDVVKGKLEGKFIFSELMKVTQNALSSTYSNYEPEVVKPNQFINFDFIIYNQIVDIFFPDIYVDKNTRIKGKINGNKKSVKLTFFSPKIKVFKNVLDNINFRIDNKNKLYNTHLTVDKLKNKYYNISNLNLINKTKNDTLFFKSTFKGLKNKKEKFELDFFYTINNEKKSVLGIQKSIFTNKNNNWIINPKKDKKNNLTFNVKDNYFKFNPFLLVSNDQKIEISGEINGEKNKNLTATFSNVNLISFLPEIQDLKLEGTLNGSINIFQENEIVKPQVDIVVNDIIVNDFSQGTLKAQIKGDNSFKKYDVNFSLRDYKFDNIKAIGSVDFSLSKPTMDLLIKFNEYELNGFSNFGGDVITNLRGRLSGEFRSKGELLNPELIGELKIKDGGLTFPYLNIDFDLIKNTKIKLKGHEFKLKNIVIQDTKNDTKGLLSGSIAYQSFKLWALNLDLNTDKLLILDTKEAEEIPYYGKAFLKGVAKIRGLTSNLIIDINGKTQKGTLFVIPLSDITTVKKFKLIRFKTEEPIDNKSYEIEKIKGLNLKINLDVTKDAVAQIVIDKNSGSDIKGSGTGKLDIEIDTRGKFIINGDIEIDNGFYNFKYGGIITKPFKVQKGSTISWSGDPIDAELNLTAIYQTKANPAQLLDNINFSRKIPINLYTKISGGLFDSKQDFDIKIPNANSVIASELSFKLNDNDINTKMHHFVWLLATGTFYHQGKIGKSVNAGITGTATSVASGLLSNLLNSDDSKFKVDVGFTQADKTNINKSNNALDNVVDVSVSTEISKGVLFNGKLGVPVGANTQTNVVGEAQLEVLLNKVGSLRWIIFNKPNDIQYKIEEEGYTQGTGLSYQVNFNNIGELIKKIGLIKKSRKYTVYNKLNLINNKKSNDTIKR